MDEFYCVAFPDFTASATDSVSEDAFCPDDQHFNVKFECKEMYVLNASKLDTRYDVTHSCFQTIPKDKMMQEPTIVSLLSSMAVPEAAHNVVVAKILACARDMANRTHKHQKVLHMCVDVIIPRLGVELDEISEDDDDFSEEEEEGDDGVVVESTEDQDHGLVPAAKSSIEELEMVRVEQEGSVQGRCAICFEDIVVGVSMPCLHVFHSNCIVDWLEIGNSCPLCRFQMPTREGNEPS